MVLLEYKVQTWSKASSYKAKNNLVAHERIKYPRYVPSYCLNYEPVNMWDLMSHGYGRQNNIERIAFIRKQQEELLFKQTWFKERQKRMMENVKNKRLSKPKQSDPK